MMRLLPLFKNTLMEFLFPPICEYCTHYAPYPTVLCCQCRQILQSSSYTEPLQPNRWALYPARAIALQLIYGLKYAGNTAALQELFWCSTLDFSVLDHCLFVPIPLHPARKRERGYNQAAHICKQLVRRTHNTKMVELIKRIRQSGSQTKLGKEEREKNMANIFCPSNTKQQHQYNLEQTICIVDDVYTTGATTQAAKQCLQAMGFTNIITFSVLNAEKTNETEDFALSLAHFINKK